MSTQVQYMNLEIKLGFYQKYKIKRFYLSIVCKKALWTQNIETIDFHFDLNLLFYGIFWQIKIISCSFI